MKPTGRLVFANELRGVAALTVAASHLLGVYWFFREAVSAATFTPQQAGPVHEWAMAIAFRWFSLGPFGVGLFFLISGLVIPFSLEHHTRGEFILARLLRIYPTYIVAVVLEIGLLAANAHAWGLPFGHSAWTLISNALLLQDLVGRPSIDLVNWTLCIELRFYLVIAIFAHAIRRASVKAIFGIALMALAINLAVVAGAFGPAEPDPLLPAYTASTEPLFIIFMLIGVLFNFHCRGRLSTQRLLIAVPALVLLFLLCWRESVLAYQLPGVAENYLCALVLFAALYAGRRYAKPVPVLHQLAAISYPFYIVHPLVGYSVMRLTMLRWGAPYPLSLAFAIAACLLIATLLHVTVERPTMHAMGRGARARLAAVAAE